MLSNSPPIKEPHKSAEMDDQRLPPTCLNHKTGSRAYISRDVHVGYFGIAIATTRSLRTPHHYICLFRYSFAHHTVHSSCSPPLPLTPNYTQPAHVVQHGGHPHPPSRRANRPSPLSSGTRLHCPCKQLRLLLFLAIWVKVATKA